ncbi:hypothetical protein CYMTET_51788, partial [Cymbomonas tetramitiformis]
GRFRWPETCTADTVPAEATTALAFFQDIPHEGEPVEEGAVKYLIRTDIMYERVEPICNSPADIQAFKWYREAELLEADGDADAAAKLFFKCFKTSPALAKVYGM